MSDTKRTNAAHRRLLPFPLLFAGCVFLCNPTVNLFDILPDFIGYLLLLLSLRYASDAFAHFGQAERGFRILFWVSLAKLPALFLMTSVVGKNMDERGLIAVFAIAFAVLEMIFIIPAFRALFEGFSYLGERYGVKAALGDERGGVDKLTLFTLIFLVCKHALSFLPELVLTSTFFYNGSLNPAAVNPVSFYPLLAFLGVVVGFVLGIVFITRMHAYLKALGRDAAMDALLSQEYRMQSDAISASDLRRRQLTLLSFLLAGFFFAIDPVIGGADLLPNIGSALCFFFVFWALCDKTLQKRGRILSLFYGAASLGDTVFSALFFSSYELTDIAYREAALRAYIPCVAFRVLEGVLFFITVLLALRVLGDFITAYTGHSLRASDTVLRNEVHTELLRKTKRLRLFSLLYAVLRPICAALMVLTDRHVVTEDEANQFYAEGAVIYTSRFSYLWIVVLVFGIFLTVYAFFLVGDVKSEANLSKED